jgi:hypothetical protein
MRIKEESSLLSLMKNNYGYIAGSVSISHNGPAVSVSKRCRATGGRCENYKFSFRCHKAEEARHGAVFARHGTS